MSETNDSQGYPKLDVRAARALNPRTFQIKIESILGGIADSEFFPGKDQFRFSLGIDPSLGSHDQLVNNVSFSGLLRPTVLPTVDYTQIQKPPLWIVENPKDGGFYIYDFRGSTYSIPFGVMTPLSDAGLMVNATGNGAAYYDNYIYFAKNTTIARYGPLDGTPKFDGDYWTTTLSKAALNNTTYPITVAAPSVNYPNHVMHRHSDGKLYIADVQNNQGVLHVISTTKTTVEGDTDNSSSFQKITFGYGLYPTAIETYGSSLVISFLETNTTVTGSQKTRAKIAFWDTTSQNFNSIIWVEFPDGFITGLKNLNGTLYIISGETSSYGFRISRYIGGFSIEDVAVYAFGYPPLPGAIVADGNRLMFGVQAYGGANILDGTGAVFSLGLGNTRLGQHMFSNIRASGTVTALAASRNSSTTAITLPIVAWSKGLTSPNGIDVPTNGGYPYTQNPAYFESQIYRTGGSFKITKIRIPFVAKLTTNMSLTPAIYDSNDTLIQTLTTITGSNYPNKRVVTLRPQNLIVNSDFYMSLQWGGADLCTVGLPIVITCEPVEDDQ